MSADVAFALDPQLQADTQPVGDLLFSRVLLMDDARFPWLILVPRIAGLRELIELSADDQKRLLDDINRAAHVLHAIENPDKLNIAMLGNVVSQFHVHVIARFARDAAWPKPVWGVGERTRYSAYELRRYADEMAVALQLRAS
ncbi:MAG TPA: HIT family protein [Rudaea sp.]|jgi:diadenosine tetraphosphate (Ap4A) HIT family hydrolase|nr:HIT family protein [Rudaea sp.]